MEAANINENQQKRKRGGEDDNNPAESKKHESSYSYQQRRYEFYDGIGVFDFPWLKEKEGTVVFNQQDDDNFSYLHQDNLVNLDQSHNFQLDSNLIINSSHDDDRSLLSSLRVDDHDPLEEPLDCIWSCVVDHPLDLGFIKVKG